MNSVSKIRVEQLGHTFEPPRAIQALASIDLAVEENAFVCVVGPSGCGKTTLLRLIAGFERPTIGRICVSGKEVSRPGADRGVVFQADAVFPWLSVWANVEFGPRCRGWSPQERRAIADRYISLVGLRGFEQAFPRELSGGMRKRVDIARAYANKPDVLLMDEPFGSLDADTKERMQDELLRIWQTDRKTVLFVTHDLEEALYLGDRIVVLSSRPGRIKEIVHTPFGYPRSQELKVTEAFVRLRKHVWELMRANA